MITIRRVVIGIAVQRKSDNEIDWLAQDSDCSDGPREQGTRSPIELLWTAKKVINPHHTQYSPAKSL